MGLVSKLILGTVQFGVNYGINNQIGQVKKDEVRIILDVAQSSGIKCLDTSSGYGESENVLGEVIASERLNFNIVSKYFDTKLRPIIVFNQSLQRLKVNHLYGYLIHHFEDFIDDATLWDDMNSLKQEGKIDKIGFSLYNVGQLQYLLDKNINFNIVQFPYNIFDRQFESYFSILKEKGIEIHTRSSFLQGLFFKDINTLPNKLLSLKKPIENLHSYCKKNRITIEQLALNYVINNQYVDGILIGVDTCAQLKANIDVLDKKILQQDIDFISSIEIAEKALLNPVNWK